MLLVVVVGRHWPLSSGLGRPRDGPASAHSADGRHFDMTRLNLSRRQSATMAGAPTDHARVCLAAPPPASATLILPLNRASCDGHIVITAPEPSAVELPVIREGGEVALGADRRPSRSLLSPVVSLARVRHGHGRRPPTPDRGATRGSRPSSPLPAQSAGSLPKLEVRALT